MLTTTPPTPEIYYQVEYKPEGGSWAVVVLTRFATLQDADELWQKLQRRTHPDAYIFRLVRVTAEVINQ